MLQIYMFILKCQNILSTFIKRNDELCQILLGIALMS